MTSVLPPGRYKQKKEWSTSSIPEMLANSSELENEEPEPVKSNIEIQVNGVRQEFQSGRRSSLAIGLFSDGADDRKLNQHNAPVPEKHNKRRSSIAVAFLGRKDNAKVNLKSGASSVPN